MTSSPGFGPDNMDRGPNDQPTEAKGERVVLFAEADPFLTKIF